ncbi:helix-turn-helix domain-containing protein [Streptomyces odonnellii]|uniref:helix-turn-helix domain-containing protein n=1 Tax=Streptomyces odonnellii TaxID=1417980 RepID=UPI000626A49E|nr:GAF domain-containing protein [Streptomyces odonnellii]
MNSGRMFLELLARDAPAAEFEELVIAARADGGSAGTAGAVAELERSKLLALRVRAALDKSRRRETELSALYETVADLVALRDVDSVLQAIVARARKLLGTDTAYLALYDPERGCAYMRETNGSVSAKFQQLLMPLGAGLGGLVVQTASPYFSSSYLGDAQFRHTREIDEAVTEEGLIAILGVPLRLGGDVIGVLYAADRSERGFAHDEVALLGSLAAHAAVALDNARLLQETHTALADLNAANRLVQTRSASVERAAAAYERFTGLVVRGGGVDDIAHAVGEALNGSVVVVGPDGRPLSRVAEPRRPDGDFGADGHIGAEGHAGTEGRVAGRSGTESRPDGGSGPGPGPGPEEWPGAAALADAMARSRAEGRAVTCGNCTVAAVVADQEPLGALVISGAGGAGGLDDTDRVILERGVTVTALLLLFRTSLAQAEERVRGELLTDLLSRRPGGGRHGGGSLAVRERARRLGTDLDKPHVVAVVAADDVPTQRVSAAAGAWAGARRGLAGRHEGRTVLLVPGDDPSAVARAVEAGLRTALARPVTVGAAGPPDGTAVADAYAEALQCLGALQALGRGGSASAMDDLGFLGLVLGRHADTGGFVRRTLGPLVEYDERRGTSLLDTVESYFQHGQSLARTGAALHVHVNTVSQRLERVGQILGEDWNTPQYALEAQLALQLRRVLATA